MAVLLINILQIHYYYISETSTEAAYTAVAWQGWAFYLAVAVIQIGIHLFVWNKMTYTSVNAIRYLNPSWNKVSHGNRLLPSLAYLSGRASYDENTESQEPAQLLAKVQEQVWSLIVEM